MEIQTGKLGLQEFRKGHIVQGLRRSQLLLAFSLFLQGPHLSLVIMSWK